MVHNIKLIIEDTSHVGLIKHFLNTKTQSHKVVIAEGKYREAIIAVGINIVYPPNTLQSTKIPCAKVREYYQSAIYSLLTVHTSLLISR